MAIEVMHRAAIEENDRYIIPIEKRWVSRCYFDGRFGLCFYSDGPQTEIAIATELRLKQSEHQTTGNPEIPGSLAPMLSLFGQRVSKAYAYKNGRLSVEFDTGLHLEVEPNSRFEAWEVSAQDGLKLVATPGGGVAFWQSVRQENGKPQ